ncbi:MAG: TIR domain-containing protein, partial [Verrucomicrobiota bacterium]
MEADPTDVFLSHSSKDDLFIQQLHPLLRDLGLGTIFNDAYSLRTGSEFWPEIEQAITECQKFVVVVSSASMASKWVPKEVELARSLNKEIFPILIEDCDTSLFDGITMRDFRSQFQAPQTAQKKLIRPNTKGLPETYTGKLYGRDTELAQLLTDLGEKNTHIVAYDAMGGTGKTALLYHFVQDLREKDWPNLDSVFIWSFYSQGSSEDKQTHAQDFFHAAYDHFHPDGRAGMPDVQRDQGLELAELIANQRTLLILDGLEPLQYAAGGNNQQTHKYGGIKDQGVKALLSRLADIGDTGLTIVTTRIKIHELEDHRAFQSRPLDQLPTEAAIDLLRDRGIEAKTFPPETSTDLPETVRADFVQAIESLQHHALSLNLAAHLVANDYEGQIRAFADVLPHLHDDSDIDANHRSPFRVMRALEAGLYRVLHQRIRPKEQDGKGMSAQKAIEDSPAANQLALLYFLGLFDRPAALDLLPVVYDASEDLREAVHMLPEDKAEYLRQVKEEAKKRDQVLNDPNSSEDDRLAARHHFETQFYQRSFHYWLPPVFARFDNSPGRITNALKQLNQQGLVSQARLTKGEGGHAEWETLAGDKAWNKHHVDCHPLIREYFGHQLEREYPKAFQEAHGRLYDGFRFAGLPEDYQNPIAYAALGIVAAFPQNKGPNQRALAEGQNPGGGIPTTLIECSPEERKEAAKVIGREDFQTALQTFLPADETGMTPLFAAIGHGCLAGRHAECFSEVYRPRITRGNENYATKKLGLYGQDLAALASFFLTRDVETGEALPPFSTPHPDLSPSHQALVLSLAGFRLRAIGRLPDAVPPFREYARLTAEDENWKHTAAGHGNLSELLLTLGHLERDEEGEAGALPTAEAAVTYADQSGDLFQRMGQLAKQANALLAAGRLGEAEARFREAEALQRQRQPQLPRLYSLGGFLYGDLLLAR